MLPRLLYAAVALCLIGTLPVARPGRGAANPAATEGSRAGRPLLVRSRADVLRPASALAAEAAPPRGR
jgi:hypothetical protein